MYFKLTYKDTILENATPGDSVILYSDKSIWILINKIPKERTVLMRKIGEDSEGHLFSEKTRCKKVIESVLVERGL